MILSTINYHLSNHGRKLTARIDKFLRGLILQQTLTEKCFEKQCENEFDYDCVEMELLA